MKLNYIDTLLNAVSSWSSQWNQSEVKGCKQIPDIDFHYSFSTLAKDTTISIFRVLPLCNTSVQSRWVAELIVVEAAFLSAEADRYIFEGL